MILKVKVDEGWSYFECEVIHSKIQLLKDVKHPLGDCVVLLKKSSEDPRTSILNVKILNLETKSSHFRTVLTDKPCYILNDRGNTIDKT